MSCHACAQKFNKKEARFCCGLHAGERDEDSSAHESRGKLGHREGKWVVRSH